MYTICYVTFLVILSRLFIYLFLWIGVTVWSVISLLQCVSPLLCCCCHIYVYKLQAYNTNVSCTYFLSQEKKKYAIILPFIITYISRFTSVLYLFGFRLLSNVFFSFSLKLPVVFIFIVEV